MSHDWIIDVLADLKTFARQNGLGAVAEQLDDTMHVAAIEIATKEGCVPRAATSDAEQARDGHLAHAAGGNA